MTEHEALFAIAKILNDCDEWSPETLDLVAQVFYDGGYAVSGGGSFRSLMNREHPTERKPVMPPTWRDLEDRGSNTLADAEQAERWRAREAGETDEGGES